VQLGERTVQFLPYFSKSIKISWRQLELGWPLAIVSIHLTLMGARTIGVLDLIDPGLRNLTAL